MKTNLPTGANTPVNQLLHAAYPSIFAQSCLGFTPDPAQKSVLDSKAGRAILCCTRQWGKSTTTAALAIHTAYFQPESLVLIGAPTVRQSAELLRKARKFLTAIGIKPRGDGQSQHSLLLPNGARIVALPNDEDNVRGYSAPALIVIDEAARVPDDLYHAFLPMLAASPSGRIWLLSTPNGKQGFFAREWHDSTNGFYKLAVPATDCPRILPAFLDAESRRMPRYAFEQEYLCRFHSPAGTLFPDDILQAAFDYDIWPIKGAR